jgi:hypothetical protein
MRAKSTQAPTQQQVPAEWMPGLEALEQIESRGASRPVALQTLETAIAAGRLPNARLRRLADSFQSDTDAMLLLRGPLVLTEIDDQKVMISVLDQAGIYFLRRDVDRLWPRIAGQRIPFDDAPRAPLGPKEWLADAVKQLRAEPNYPKRIGDAARILQSRMRTALRVGECTTAWKARHVENQLRLLELWPQRLPARNERHTT